jgi:hypothetical protein
MADRCTMSRRFLVLLAVTLAALGAAVATGGTARAQPLDDREIVAVVGLDGQLWVSGLTGSPGGSWQPLGGHLVDAAPIVVRGAFEVYFLGLGADHNVWIRTPDQGWRPYGPDGTWCEGPGAAAVSDTFAVACRGADGAAWIAGTILPLAPDVVPTARGPESVGWRSLGGQIQFGAAVTGYQPVPQQPEVAVVAVGADGTPWFNTYSTGWRQFSAEPCAGALAASPAFEVFACTAPNGQLKVFHPRSGAGATLLGGQILGRPGVAAFASGQVDYFVLGTDSGVWLTRQRAAGGQDPYTRLNALGRYGVSAVAPR